MADNVEKLGNPDTINNRRISPSAQLQAGNPAVRFNAFQTLTLIVALLVTAGVAFLGGVVYDRQQGLAYSDDFKVFWEAWNYIDDQYYEEPPAVKDRVYGGIAGVLQALNDPYSNVSPPVLAEEHREVIEGKFGGIGASVSVNEAGEPFIVQVIEDRCIAQTPASKAGLQANDIIRAVDGQDVTGWELERVVDVVKGHEGTDVVLTIYRAEGDETFDVRIRREIVEQITVADQMIDDVGYLRLALFNGVATRQLQCKLENLLTQSPRAIIFDLRGNGGGLLDQALSVADLFLDQGLIVSQRDRAGNQEDMFSTNGQIGENIPMAVLIDRGSASASEVVAGALQDRHRALLVGQNSFGKGSVQNVYTLSDGGELRVTAAAWYTPDGRRIHGIGLEPDIIVDGEQVDENGQDRFLAAALEYVNQAFPGENEDSDEQPSEESTAPVSLLPAMRV